MSRADLEKYAEQVGGINMAKFKAALDTNKHKAAVQADMDAVEKAGARIGTPSFFINGKLLQGAQPFDAFKTAIDKAALSRQVGVLPRPARERWRRGRRVLDLPPRCFGAISSASRLNGKECELRRSYDARRSKPWHCSALFMLRGPEWPRLVAQQ